MKSPLSKTSCSAANTAANTSSFNRLYLRIGFSIAGTEERLLAVASVHAALPEDLVIGAETLALTKKTLVFTNAPCSFGTLEEKKVNP